MFLLFLLGLFSRPTAALCPISKAVSLQAKWSSTTSPGSLVLHNFLQFGVVLQRGSKARGMLKVPAQGVSRVLCAGNRIIASWNRPAPVVAPETSQRCSRVDGEVQFQNAQNLPVAHHPWVTDMVITKSVHA